MSFTLFSIALLMIFVVAAVIEVYRMLRRDSVRVVISGATVLFSVLLSVILSPIISIAIVNVLYANLQRIRGFSDLLASGGHMIHFIIAFVCIVLSTLLFMLLFFLTRLLLSIALAAIYRTLLKRNRGDTGYAVEKSSWLDKNRKVIAILIGVLNAFVITVVIVTPVMGTLNVASRAVGIAEKFDENIWKSAGSDGVEVVDGLRKYSADAVGNLFYHCGGDYIYSAVATTMLYDRTVYLDNEIDCLEEMVEDFVTIIPIFTEPEEVTSTHVDALYNVCGQLEKMELSKPLLAEYVSKGAGAWLRGNSYYSVPKPMMNEMIDPTFNELLHVCAGVNIHNAQRNTVSLLRIYAIILDSGLLSLEDYEYDTMVAFLQETAIIERLSEELNKNPDMSGISDTVSSIALGLVAMRLEQMDLGELEYDGLMSDLADAVESVKNVENPEEQVQMLTDYTKEFLGEHDVQIPDDVTKYASEKLLEVLLSESGTVTAARIEEFFREYQS